MSFKSATQPLCRFCGKPIRKRTDWVRFGVAPVELENGRGRVERPATRAEAQRFVNGKITASRFATAARIDAPDGRATRMIAVDRYVREVSVWDGETYEDEFFCTGEHAKLFGYASARWEGGRLRMPAYDEAIAKRKTAT